MFRGLRTPYILFNRNMSTDDEYKKAIAALNLLQSLKTSERPKQYPFKLVRIGHYLERCGIRMEQLEKDLSIIHVSGTKGKGSTCAFCESILRHCGYTTGFFSSPHLISVCERIRINGKPVSKQTFVQYFWEMYNTLSNTTKDPETRMPSYFTFLCILALKIFHVQKVDVVILEVGIGGEYDDTNAFSNTSVAGITSLGFDHIKLLGNTIEEIAWQKAGIMKPGSIAVTAANQPSNAMPVLQSIAKERNCILYVAPHLADYDCDRVMELGIKGPVQHVNASVALQLANAWINSNSYRRPTDETIPIAPTFKISNKMYQGLKECKWQGRTQELITSPRLTYYLDGAHTVESMQICKQWYSNTAIDRSRKRVLVFNVIGGRDTKSLLKILIACDFDYAFFCTNYIDDSDDMGSGLYVRYDVTSMKSARDKDIHQCENTMSEWIEFGGSKTTSRTFETVSETISNLEKFEHSASVLVTGSLHLVGAFLSILDPNLEH